MNIEFSRYKTTPKTNKENGSYFYQCEILPCFSIIRYKDDDWKGTEYESNYYTFSFTWLFWSWLITINF